MQLKEFILEDLFEKVQIKTLKYKVKDLPKHKNDIFNLPALTAWIENQWLSCFVPREWATIIRNCISVSANGANTWAMFYQPNEFTVLQDSYALKYKFNWFEANEKIYLFLIATIQKTLKELKFDWSNKAGRTKIKNIKIQLPTSDWVNPNYKFMEEKITELGKERIIELETYLNIAGLNDYELTEDEQEILSLSEKMNKEELDYININWDYVKVKDFKVGDLFDIHPTKAYKLTNEDLLDNDWNNPVITNWFINNWIWWYSKKATNENWWIITFSDTWTKSTESFFYQWEPFIWYPHVQWMYAKNNHKWTERQSLFLISLLKNKVKWKYDYSTKMTRVNISNMVIQLPTSDWVNPDYDLMEKYIKVQEKLINKKLLSTEEQKTFREIEEWEIELWNFLRLFQL